jgi:hypothetical protein
MKSLCIAAALSLLAASAGAQATPGAAERGEVNPDDAEKVFVTPDTNDFLASRIIGTPVLNLQDETIGDVVDLIVRDGHELTGVVVGVGGFLGLGEHNVALKMDKFQFRPSENGRVMVILTASKEELQATPAFKSKADQEAEAARNAPRPTTTPSGGAGGTSKAN